MKDECVLFPEYAEQLFQVYLDLTLGNSNDRADIYSECERKCACKNDKERHSYTNRCC